MKKYTILVMIIIMSVILSAQKEMKFTSSDLALVTNSIQEKRKLILPFQDGNFTFKKSIIYHQNSRERSHEIETYDIVHSSSGFPGKLVISKKRIYYSLITKNGIEIYNSDFATQTIYRDNERDNLEKVKCEMIDIDRIGKSSQRDEVGAFNSGENQNIFRLAIIATGEFYEAAGNSDDLVTAKIIETLSTVNLVMEREVATTFVLDDRIHLFKNKLTDPYTPASFAEAEPRPLQSSSAFQDIFSFESYDLGITFNAFETGWFGGGSAILNAACRETIADYGPIKAACFATSNGFTPNLSPFNFINTICHEIGHTFSALHTFNSDDDNCFSQISESNSYEIGGGTTIMSYHFACGDDSYDGVGNDLDKGFYFHSSSLHQIISFIESKDCQVRIEQTNAIPTINTNPCNLASFDIPLDTRFSMSAIADDIDSDSLLFIWEQFDEDGPGTPTAGNFGTSAALSDIGPLMRNWDLDYSSRRNIPGVVTTGGYLYEFERLSLVPRNLNFRFTARDNHPSAGAISSDQITINVLDIGPLELNVEGVENDIEGGETIEITWNDDGVSTICDKVDIEIISWFQLFDTFSYSVAKNVDFVDKKVSFQFPPFFESGSYIVKLKCADNDCFYFYQESERFEVYNSCTPYLSDNFYCNLDDITANFGSEELNLNIEVLTGSSFFTTPEISLGPENDRYPFIRYTLEDECTFLKDSGGNPSLYPYKLLNLTVEKEGTYYFRHQGDAASVVIFDKEIFESVSENPELICSAVLGASTKESATTPGSTSFLFNSRVELDPCKEYLLGISMWSPGTYKAEIRNGAGKAYVKEFMNIPNVQYAVINNSEELVAIKSTPDFRDILPGKYKIVPVNFENLEDLGFLIGLTIQEVQLQGYCIYDDYHISSFEVIDSDTDGDGYPASDDCDDMDAAINPDAEEIANNDIDENCDGELLIIDLDIDGFNSDLDCDDSNAAVNPEAEEIPNNDIDENCDGIALVIDEDLDGYNSSIDCNDLDSLINPGAIEIPNNDIDEDCDGFANVIDEDMDGFNSDNDCNDLDSLISPDAVEIPNNGIDENCDGEDLVSSLDEELDLKIEFFPNPMSDLLQIKSPIEPIMVVIQNIHGQVMSKSTLLSKYHVIKVGELPPGLYIFTTYDQEGKLRASEKLIKF